MTDISKLQVKRKGEKCGVELEVEPFIRTEGKQEGCCLTASGSEQKMFQSFPVSQTLKQNIPNWLSWGSMYNL